MVLMILIAGTSFWVATVDDVRGLCMSRARPGWNMAAELEKVANDPACVALACRDGAMLVGIRLVRGLPTMMILFAGSKHGARDVFHRREAELDVLAREFGVARIAFKSQRRGWARLAGANWDRVGDLFTRSVA